MQINYTYYQKRRAFPLYWYAPDISNSLRWVNIPPLYAPYGTFGWWKQAATPPSGDQVSLAPNSGDRTSIVRNSFAPGGEPAPAPTVADAIITGAPVGPITLTSPMPSITPPAASQVTVATSPQPSTGQWAASNPLLAVGLAGLLYVLLKGKCK